MIRRLILFDIDGTLLSGGPARAAFELALRATFGTAGAIDTHEFSGKTDPQIARELLVGAGLEPIAVDRGLPDLYRRYLGELEARLVDRPTVALPGAHQALTELEAEKTTALGLLTGNIQDGARLKLASARIETRFEVGAFGSDAEDRNSLPEVALVRAEARWGQGLDPDAVVIVGDTPRDVECGREAGMRTVGVATGRYPEEALEEAGADRVFAGLDAPGVLDVLMGVGETEPAPGSSGLGEG